jgi:hypothetical protein
MDKYASTGTHTVSIQNSMNRALDVPVVCNDLREAMEVAKAWWEREGRDLHIANLMGVVATWSSEGPSFKVASMAPRHRSTFSVG